MKVIACYKLGSLDLGDKLSTCIVHQTGRSVEIRAPKWLLNIAPKREEGDRGKSFLMNIGDMCFFLLFDILALSFSIFRRSRFNART